jgi:hypothetical protein
MAAGIHGRKYISVGRLSTRLMRLSRDCKTLTRLPQISLFSLVGGFSCPAGAGMLSLMPYTEERVGE